MKTQSALRALLLGVSFVALPYAQAATLYWDGGTTNIGTDGNGVSLGTAGNWDTTLTNWDQGSGLAHVAWINSNFDIALFGGTAGTVTLTAPITVGGLSFYTGSGYIINAGTQGLTFGATNNTISLINSNGATSSATIQGTVGGSGNVILTSTAADVASTLFLTGTSTTGWSGTTTINANSTLALSGLNQGLVSTSGITLNGGNITLTNTSAIEAALDRVNSSAAITSYGGNITVTNTASATTVYSETMGALDLRAGQLNITSTNANTADVATQTLTFGSGSLTTVNGAARTNATTSAINFSGASLGANVRNSIIIAGQADTAQNEIIAPWVTFGSTANTQTDYAVYNRAGSANASTNSLGIQGAAIAATAQSAWSTDYTTGTGTLNNTANAGLGAITLSGGAGRNINSLRSISAANAVTVNDFGNVFNLTGHNFQNGDVVVFGGTTAAGNTSLGTVYYVVNRTANNFQVSATQGGAFIDLSNAGTAVTATGALLVSTGNNLGTLGILNGVASTMYIAATGTGVVTLPTTTANNLHVTAGAGAITIFAPITNNGAGILTLVKNGSSTLTLSGTNTYTGGTVLNAGTLAIGNVNNIGGAGASLTFGGTATLAPSAGLNFSTGTLNVNAGAYGTITGNGTTAFQTTSGTGTLRYTSGASTGILNLGNADGFTGNLEFRLTGNAGYGTGGPLLFSDLGDGGVLRVGGGQSDATAPGQRAGIVFNGSAPLVFNNRVIELLPRTASNHTVSTTTLYNNSATANIWTINTNLSNLNVDARSFELAGTNTGNNAFNGIIGDGNTGGTINFRKDGTGTWILGGNNTYTGTTTIIGGVLRITKNTSLGTVAGGVTQSGTSALEIDGTSGAVIVGAEAISVNGGGISNGGAIRNIAGDNTYGGTVTLAAQSRINSDSGTLLFNNATAITGAAQNLVVGGAGNVTISGAITTTTGFVSKDGAGTLTLSGTNTYTGKTIVGAGTLSFSAGDASATADQQLGKNAALDLGVAATSSGRLLYTGGAGTLAKNINALGNGTDTIENGGTGLLTLTGTLTKNGTILTLKGGANGITVSGTGTITGRNFNSDLIIDGGVVTLETANTYNGPTFIINGATLNANAVNALPTSINRTAVSMDQTGSGSSALAMSVSQSIASLTGAATSTVNLNSNTLTIGTATGSSTFAGVISGTGGNLIKDGASILTLTNTNTYDGTTTITGGILRVDGSGSLSTGAVNVSAGALGGAGGTINGAVTLSGTGGINLVSGVVGDLSLASTLDITGSAGANSLNFDLGSAAGGTDKIIVGGATTVTNNGVVVAFNQIGGNAARIDAGTYTILQGSSALDIANYSLATTRAFGNTYLLQVTGNNLEVVTTQAATGPATAFWWGAGGNNWSTAGSWKDAIAGAVLGAAPGYNTNVTFSATSATNTTTNVLDVDFDINSLTFNSLTGNVTIGGTKMLTLESSGTAITSSNTSNTNIINANVGMAASQSWSVAGGGTLRVNGNITDFGAGRTLTKTGTGTLRLDGNNTYSGGTTLSAGVLSIGSNTALPSTGTIALNGGTIQSSDATARSFSNLVTIGGDFTVGGTGNMTFSNTGAISLGATRSITVTTSGVNATFAQAFSGSGFGITKAGAGTLTLTGNNTYTGTTTVSAGTVNLTGNNSLGTVTVTAGTLKFTGGTNSIGAVTTGTGLFTIDGGTTSNSSIALGAGGSMSIINGGTLSTTAGGATTAFQSNTSVTITGGTGVTSTWNLNGGDLGTVANNHNNGTFLIDGAGTAGSARVINVGILTWGRTLSNATLTLTNGGQMNVNGEIRMGNPYYNTTGNSNIVIGGGTATSTLTGNNQALYIGYGERNQNINNDVIVNSNGVLTGIGSVIIGNTNYGVAQGTATNNKLTVSGTGTASIANLIVGYAQNAINAANANLVEVTGGGTLTTTSGINYIGRAEPAGGVSNSNSATVTGTGSTWNASNQNVIVGFTNNATATSNNNILTVGAGGTLSNVGTLTVGSGTGTETGNQLMVNGSLSATSVSVSASNSLGGSGAITGAVTVSSGGFISSGDSTGDITGTLSITGAYTQAGLYTANIADITAGNFDQINVTGAVNISGGSLSAMFSGGTYAANDLIFILLNDSTDAITGTYATYADGATVATYGGYNWNISYFADSGTTSFTGGNDIALRAELIPEPKAALLGCLGVLLLLRRRR